MSRDTYTEFKSLLHAFLRHRQRFDWQVVNLKKYEEVHLQLKKKRERHTVAHGFDAHNDIRSTLVYNILTPAKAA